MPLNHGREFPLCHVGPSTWFMWQDGFLGLKLSSYHPGVLCRTPPRGLWTVSGDVFGCHRGWASAWEQGCCPHPAAYQGTAHSKGPEMATVSKLRNHSSGHWGRMFYHWPLLVVLPELAGNCLMHPDYQGWILTAVDMCWHFASATRKVNLYLPENSSWRKFI